MPLVNRAPDLSKKSRVQSVLFDINRWSEKEARKWLKEHHCYRPPVHKTAKYLRFRQYDPAPGEIFRLVKASNGISIIIGLNP
jgi:hypothetical protein